MNRRKLLVKGTVIIGLVGLSLTMIPFIMSLSPSPKADAALPRINVNQLAPGQFLYQKHPIPGKLYNGYEWSILIYKKYDGSIKVWNLQTKNGGIGMPDIHWWRFIMDCQDFGPTKVNGQVDENLSIQCRDKSVSDWWRKQWAWDIDGKNVEGMVDDLEVTKGRVEGDYFVFQYHS
jgi:hypothetical protein